MKLIRPVSTQPGFSLVEVMVGLVIGMLGIMVIMQVFAVSEGQKRTTTSGGDAQANGIAAIAAIERDARQGGYGYTSFPGVSSNPLLGCTILAYNENAPSKTLPPIRLYPVRITDGGGSAPDTVTIIYSTSTGLSAPVSFKETYNGSAANYKVTNSLGVNFGDLIVAVESGKKCSLTEVTGPGNYVKGAPIDKDNGNIVFARGINGPFNPSGGHKELYCESGPPCGAYLINLGIPVTRQYWVATTSAIVPANTLVSSDLLFGDPSATNALTLADNVVNLQAQYGVDTNGDNIIDSWQEATGATYGDNGATTPTGATIATIKAVRIAVIARSSLRERANSSSVCDITTASPVVFADGPAITVDLSGDANWKCHRYQVYQTTIPLRNLIWNAS